MTNNSKIKLNKQEIAIRHTNQAIRMFFKREEPISILVIACAANEILSTLAQKNNIKTAVGKNNYLIKDEYKKEVNKIRNKEYNFFKHADKDYDKSIEFNQEIIYFFILENIILIKQLNLTFSKEMAYFYIWIIFSKRKFFYKNELIDNYLKNNELIDFENFFYNFDKLFYSFNINPEFIKNSIMAF